jgi:hypothetical protein
MMHGRRADTRKEVEIEYTEEDTGGSRRRALEESTGAQVRLIRQARERCDEEKVWQIHDRMGESLVCILLKARAEKPAPGHITIITLCIGERWDMQAEATWGEAELIRALMVDYRPVAYRPPYLAIFDEDSKRRNEFELNEN